MSRRYPALALVLVALGAIVFSARETSEADVATFSLAAQGWMPFVPEVTGATETWFCPGVPASGIDGDEGAVTIANRGEHRLIGSVLLMNETSETRRLEIDIDGWSSATVDLDATLPGAVVGAVVEIDGGGAVVEQTSFQFAGTSVAPCANATSDTWFLADGFTVDGSLDQIILTNPFEQTVVANLEFATREGSRAPASYTGLTVPARSVRVIDLGAPGAGAQGEPILAVSVEASRGRLVVGRSQRFRGGGRFGSQVTVASPVLRDQWWFVNGDKDSGVSERFSIYNPTAEVVEVDVVFVGIDRPVGVDPIAVPARQVVIFESGPEPDLAEGRHATVFATQAKESVVVERAITRVADDGISTSVLLGATPRQDGYLASRWFVSAGPSTPTDDAVVLLNADNTPATVSVFAVGTSGPVLVPGLEQIELPPSSLLTIDLTDPVVIDRQLIIESTGRIFVERSFSTGVGSARTSSWAVPAG
jgi:hypothetical protein